MENSKPDNCETCHAPLVHRVGTKNNGEPYDFWGCSNYPDCKYTWSEKRPVKTKKYTGQIRSDSYEIFKKLDKVDIQQEKIIQSLKIIYDRIKIIHDRINKQLP